MNGPSPIIPPWNKPYSEWNRMQLDAGLLACDEYRWKNLERQIRQEIAERDQTNRCSNCGSKACGMSIFTKQFHCDECGHTQEASQDAYLKELL